MITSTEVHEKAMSIVKDALTHQPPGLCDSTHLIKVGALDSLGIIEVSSAISREFSIKIDNADINPSNFSTVAGISQLIQRYLHAIQVE